MSAKKVKESNRKNNGKPCVLIDGGLKKTFGSVGELTDYLTPILNRKRESVYSQCKKVLNIQNPCTTIGGYNIEYL